MDTTLADDDSEQSAIYYKSMPKSGEISTDLKMIATGFTDVVSIGTFDNQFIYVADST